MNKDFIASKKWYLVLGILAELVLLMLVFRLGMAVGFHKADYSNRFGDSYLRNFERRDRAFFDDRRTGQPGRPALPGMMGIDREMDFLGAHGAVGSVISKASDSIVIKDREGVEKSVSVTSQTEIRQFRDSIELSELVTGAFVTVVGRPNQAGQIEARLIRVMPAPPADAITDFSSGSPARPNHSTTTRGVNK